MIGTTLGAYQILAKLGEGGMGEVYRARDTKLGREVALKVLPPAVATDAERVARFEREAKTLAALNHPHIAHIYGLEAGALVMELVEGEDLAARLRRGPIPLDEALPIARQIAEGLAAAHEQGIIHRDLKPANVKVRPDGTVKVLDFGLAKAMDPGSGIGEQRLGAGAGELANSPTITTPAMTLRGVILGTAAYMAPEQAKGKPLDKRADIWAFGVVLYEMLTGRRAFDGEDVSETLAAVLRADPDWSAVPPGTPPAVTSLLRRCLERDPRKRVADMSTARFVLDDPAGLSSSGVAVPGVIATATPPRRTRTAAVAAAVLVLAVVAGMAASRLLEPHAPAAPAMRFAVTFPDGQLINAVRPMLALSPDGTHLAYVAGGRLFLRNLAEFESRPLTTDDRGVATGVVSISSPSFSPDGEWIAFYTSTDDSVQRVSVRGGSPLRVCNVPAAVGLDWHSTGIIVGLASEGIARCRPEGGEPEPLVKAEEGEMTQWPHLLPDGDSLLFTVTRVGGPADQSAGAQTAVVQSLSTGRRTTILANGGNARVLSSGHVVYTSGGVIFAAPFDAKALEVTGPAVPVVEGVRRAPSGHAHFVVSPTGMLLYLPGPVGSSSQRLLAMGDRSGAVTTLPLSAAPITHVRASRDGKRLAIGTEDGKDAIVWTYEVGTAAAMQRLTMEGRNRFPLWSPDGQYVAFQSDRGGDQAIYRQRADGTGGAERLTTASGGLVHVPESWSPDGRALSFDVFDGKAHTLSMVSLPDGRVSPFAGVRSLEPLWSNFSPDGRWVAYAATLTGDLTASNRGIFVQPYPQTGAVHQVPRQMVDFHPVWAPAGDELLFVASGSSGQMASVRVRMAGGVTFDAPTRLQATVSAARLSGDHRLWDILPDGRFVGVVDADGARRQLALSEMRLVVNWFEELKQRAPSPNP